MARPGPNRTPPGYPPGEPQGIAQGPPPVFLERQNYRSRRLRDAARLLPLAGALLFLLPLLWPRANQLAGADDPVRMSDAIFYIFAVWAGLIVAVGLFGLAVRRWGQSEPPAARGDRLE